MNLWRVTLAALFALSIVIGSGGSSLGFASSTFDVTAYGATGDGITNDTAPIQSAINDAAIRGGVVRFPAGVYRVGALMAYTNLSFRGDGPASRLKLLDNQPQFTRMFSATSVSGVIWSDLILDGNGANQPQDTIAQSHLIFLNGSSNITVERMGLENSSGDGVLVYGNPAPSDSIRIVGNRIVSPRRNGVSVVSGTNTTIAENVIVSAGLDGIDLEPDADTQAVRNIVLHANTITGTVGNGSSGGGIAVSGRPSVNSDRFRRVVISDNIIDGVTTTSGIEVNGFLDATITGNTISRTGLFGIFCRTSYAIISGNRIQTTTYQAIPIQPVVGWAIGADHVIVTNNLIGPYGNGSWPAIQLYNASDSLVSGNVLSGGLPGISVIGNSARNMVSGNLGP